MLKNYIKMACKVLLRRKYFAAVSLFAISFTLMVLMASTTLIDHMVGAMPPETHLDRTLLVTRMSLDGPRSHIDSGAGYGFLDRYTRGLPGVERMSIVGRSMEEVNTYVAGHKFKLFLRHTDGEFWKMMEFRFLEGGPYQQQDEEEGSQVVVINEATRVKLFGAQPATGRVVNLGGRIFRIIGVVADVPFFRMLSAADMWVPIGTQPSDYYRTQLVGGFNGLFRARSPDDFTAIRQEFATRLQRVEYPDPSQFNRLTGEIETITATFARMMGIKETLFPTLVVFLMVLFMILPTLNLVNMNISRMLERSSEIGVRKAFGASSGALVNQFIVENVILTLIGGLLGLVGSLVVLYCIALSGTIPYAEFHLNLRIFLAGLTLTLFFGVFSGIWPAWRMSRLHPVEALKGGL